MVQIVSITADSPLHQLDKARDLFHAYGEFLQLTGGEALFCFSRLEEEILGLPAAYAERGGELLLAMEDDLAAGCIAYRSLGSSTEAEVCEIKRLFVSPTFRGQGLGKRLVSVVLERAKAKGYATACLDTEPRSMAAAKHMYLNLGFVEDEQRNSRAERDVVVYLKKKLDITSGA